MNTAAILELLSAIKKIDEAYSVDATLDAFGVALERYGLNNYLITGLPVPHDTEWHREILGDGWPQDWYDRYIAQGHFLHDPCAARCRHRAQPFLWREVATDSITPRAQLVMDEAADFSMKDGICVPIHVPLVGPGVVTAASDRIEIPPDSFPLIEILCLHTFRKLCGLEGKEKDENQRPLTPRERQLLEWNADGKTNDDAACIMGLTINTVEHHHRNIRDKLGANNVSHAIVKALRRQEIQI
ncbi:MAG: LuxR family transcriptional regulator [Rhizobiaceae bacterium]